MRHPRVIDTGTKVRLRTGTVIGVIPVDREDNRSAVVLKIEAETKAVLLDRDLRGWRWWNLADIQPTKRTKVLQGARARDAAGR